MPNLTRVVSQLRQECNRISSEPSELERLDHDIRAIAGLSGNSNRRGSGRKISAAGRAKIAAAQKARWAKWRAKHKNASWWRKHF